MKLNYAHDDVTAASAEWLRDACPARAPAAPPVLEPAVTELELQSWELWALSTSDVVWLALVTAAAALWVVLT